MNLEQALPTFLAESAELLADMERILLEAEEGATSAEELSALFRAMHTIKGSAGLFGLSAIVDFTHRAESLLDRLRDGKLALDDAMSGLLLRCHDQVQLMLADIAAGGDASRIDCHVLCAELDQWLQGGAPAAPAHAAPSAPAPHPADGPQRWLLSLGFGPDLLRNGMDPVSFIRYLATQGELVGVVALLPTLPRHGFDPETNYVQLELLLDSPLSREELVEVFDFAADESRILVSPVTELDAHREQRLQDCDEAQIAAIADAWLTLGLTLAPAAAPEPAPIAAAPAAPPPPSAHVTQAPQHDAPSARPGAERFIKVEAGRLDKLINLIGELVIAGAAASLLAQRQGQGPLTEATSAIATLVENIRASALAMRMVPVGEIFNRFPRVVHDVARELSKPIQLHLTGADTELDKSMVEKLGDPLTHLVRNAIDHGIESPARREACGKDPCGNVWLNAYHESGSIVIEVADDGAGLNRDKILARAQERGLIAADACPGDDEIYRQIFEPGFSTADQISTLSGRGVGMDVVKRGIDELRGTIDIDTHPGWGTTFRLRMPLTLAIIDGFLVEAGASTFVLPLETVEECLEVSSEEALTPTDSGCISLRGEMLPLLKLASFLGLPATEARRRNVVVVSFGERKAGLLVDKLQGEFQTVIKPLGKLFHHLKAFSGSTILGNGDVALILDVPALIQYATHRETERFHFTGTSATTARAGG